MLFAVFMQSKLTPNILTRVFYDLRSNLTMARGDFNNQRLTSYGTIGVTGFLLIILVVIKLSAMAKNFCHFLAASLEYAERFQDLIIRTRCIGTLLIIMTWWKYRYGLNCAGDCGILLGRCLVSLSLSMHSHFRLFALKKIARSFSVYYEVSSIYLSVSHFFFFFLDFVPLEFSNFLFCPGFCMIDCDLYTKLGSNLRPMFSTEAFHEEISSNVYDLLST